MTKSKSSEGKNKKIIKIYDFVGQFAEDKDVARDIRKKFLWPNIRNNFEIELDFNKVDDATQSFVHALLSQLIRETHGEVLDSIYFKNCNATVKEIVNMVVDYMTET